MMMSDYFRRWWSVQRGGGSLPRGQWNEEEMMSGGGAFLLVWRELFSDLAFCEKVFLVKRKTITNDGSTRKKRKGESCPWANPSHLTPLAKYCWIHRVQATLTCLYLAQLNKPGELSSISIAQHFQTQLLSFCKELFRFIIRSPSALIGSHDDVFSKVCLPLLVCPCWRHDCQDEIMNTGRSSTK
eukprot:scaffold29956_cov78-Skeletonema_dohrnii-CCMP3373.AAC.1